ncbi:hypothetical protein YPPY05_2387, partial [Yersinia pestis PY-05]
MRRQTTKDPSGPAAVASNTPANQPGNSNSIMRHGS